jgi:hypothetical protein
VPPDATSTGVEPRAVRSRGALLGLLAWLVVTACSAGEADSYQWPEVHGYEIYEGATAETVIDTLIGRTYEAFGDEYAIERTVIYAIGDEVEQDRILSDYEERLHAWEAIGSGATSTGQSWERGDQRFTLALVSFDDQRLAVTLATRRR